MSDSSNSAAIPQNGLLGAGRVRYTARIVRWVNAWIYSHEELFYEAEVSSFDEALEMCKAIGSAGGLIHSDVEFTSIDRQGGAAEFKVNNRMRYEDDSFSLLVTTCT